jgi:predicted nucleic acid-binding protein
MSEAFLDTNVLLRHLLDDDPERFRRVFELYVEHGMSFADAHHVAMMERFGLDEVVTFDRGSDRVPGIRRIEP